MNDDFAHLTCQHLVDCRAGELLTTPAVFSAACNIPLADATQALKKAAGLGWFRTLTVPNFSNRIWYQPTARLMNFESKSVPKFLRSGLPPAARQRAVLRAFGRFFVQGFDTFLSVSDQAALCQKFGIPVSGHVRPLIAIDSGHYHIFIPALKSDDPESTVDTASFRWLPLLETGSATLHFISFDKAELQKIIDHESDIPPDLARLYELDAENFRDKTGMARIKNAAELAALRKKLGLGDGEYSLKLTCPSTCPKWLGKEVFQADFSQIFSKEGE